MFVFRLCYCLQSLIFLLRKKTNYSAVQKRDSKVYGKPISPSLYSISPWITPNTHQEICDVIVQMTNWEPRNYIFLAENFHSGLFWFFLEKYFSNTLNMFVQDVDQHRGFKIWWIQIYMFVNFKAINNGL